MFGQVAGEGEVSDFRAQWELKTSVYSLKFCPLPQHIVRASVGCDVELINPGFWHSTDIFALYVLNHSGREETQAIYFIFADKYKDMSWGVTAALLPVFLHVGGLEGASFVF